MKINKMKLAMFDLDGTLFDTEEANYLAYATACGEEYPLDRQFFHEKCMSENYKKFLPLIGVPQEALKEIHDKKISLYNTFFKDIKPNNSLLFMAELMKANGVKISLVTTASRKNSEELLDFFGLTEFFDLVVTQEDVTKLKPDPEAYFFAMKFFGANPEECMIFDDSDNGIKAAQATGSAVYRVTEI